MWKKQPLIGVTGPDKNHRVSWSTIAANLFLAQARMVRLTPESPQFGLALDGLIVSGGRDIDPELYGKPRKSGYPYDFGRDALEMRWAHQALSREMPLLGLCRGAQMINISLGGSLHLDIKLVCESARYPDTILSKIFARKPVVVKSGSLLHRILRREVIKVNSLHRQSLDRIGEGLVITAQEENKIIQAVESTDSGRFLLGVQWHPEFMLDAGRQRRIFRMFVHYARKQVA